MARKRRGDKKQENDGGSEKDSRDSNINPYSDNPTVESSSGSNSNSGSSGGVSFVSSVSSVSSKETSNKQEENSVQSVDGLGPYVNTNHVNSINVSNNSGGYECNKEGNLMPHDIQKIVLGDLREVTVGQCDGFIEIDDESNEDHRNQIVVEDDVCDEVESESQITEDEIVQSVAKNRKSVTDGSVNKGKSNEVVVSSSSTDIHDGQDVYMYSQGGSCEIITVSRDSDCEYVQDSDYDESYEEMEVHSTDTISAVLGVGNDFSVNIQQDDDDYENYVNTILRNEKTSDEATSPSNDNIKTEPVVSTVDTNIMEIQNEIKPEPVVSTVDANDMEIENDIKLEPVVSTVDANVIEKQNVNEINEKIINSTSQLKVSIERLSLKDINAENVKVASKSNDCDRTSDSLYSESVNNDESTVDSTVPDSKQVDSFAIFQSISSVKKEFNDDVVSSPQSLSRNLLQKTEIEEEKLPAFRSRSGSSDTTGSGSESGSTSSSGRRRSGRIKNSVALKQLVEKSSSKNSSSATNSPILAVPAVPEFDADKPVKVKSRWRRSSELEMGSRAIPDQSSLTVSSTTASNEPIKTELATASVTTTLPAVTSTLTDITDTNSSDASLFSQPAPLTGTVVPSSPSRSSTPQLPSADTSSPDDELELAEKLRTFVQLKSNEYLTGRSRSKETKRMVCDCTLSKEEIQRGESGCGEDCLNRLLMIECGSRCVLGDNCTNKRFQNVEYVKCDIFKTKKKGYGLQAIDDIPTGAFLMEYVGEVLDPKEFRRRAKEYAKVKNLHYYFMALKSDTIIDATMKGNNSRFINHSCDPNAETQKWTVNGELRIGFFSKRSILAGEEITFDYQYQRYGKEAQRCYCESALCRGWIGEDPEKEGKWSESSKDRKERKEKKKKRDVRDLLNDMDLEEEIEKLLSSGLKNRVHTLTLCRLMVRAEEASSRRRLLKLLRHGDTACLRLFLDYHGLRLIWSWMMDSDLDLKTEILETLTKLPIPNKTMLQDSKVLSMVEKWATGDKNTIKRTERYSAVWKKYRENMTLAEKKMLKSAMDRERKRIKRSLSTEEDLIKRREYDRKRRLKKKMELLEAQRQKEQSRNRIVWTQKNENNIAKPHIVTEPVITHSFTVNNERSDLANTEVLKRRKLMSGMEEVRPHISSTVIIKQPVTMSNKISQGVNAKILKRKNFNFDKEEAYKCVVNKQRKTIINLKKEVIKLKKLVETLNEKILEDNVLCPFSKRNMKPETIKEKMSADKFYVTKRKQTHYDLIKALKRFFEDETVSRMSNQEHDYVECGKFKKRRRYVLDTMCNLHKRFSKDHDIQVAYSTFTKLRPFWITIPHLTDKYF